MKSFWRIHLFQRFYYREDLSWNVGYCHLTLIPTLLPTRFTDRGISIPLRSPSTRNSTSNFPQGPVPCRTRLRLTSLPRVTRPPPPSVKTVSYRMNASIPVSCSSLDLSSFPEIGWSESPSCGSLPKSIRPCSVRTPRSYCLRHIPHSFYTLDLRLSETD